MQKDFSKYLGLKYTDEFNCSAFVEYVYRNEFKIYLKFPKKEPNLASDIESVKIVKNILDFFDKVKEPKTLDAVVMKYSGSSHYHIGIYIDGWKPKVLHCDSRTGLSSFIDFQKIISGSAMISIIGFYRLKESFFNGENKISK